MSIVKIVVAVVVFLVVATWLRTQGVNLFAPLADAATLIAGWLTTLAGWARGQA